MTPATADAAVLDIGSTRLRYGRGTPRGPVDVRSEPTRADALTEQVLDAVDRVRRRSTGGLRGVAVATTGLVDADRGAIVEFDTADGGTVRDLRLAAAVDERFSLPTVVENDCTAAAVGEWAFGAGRGCDSVAYVTFGTGIGGGVVEDGRPIRGERGYAAEVGLFPVETEGELWSTGVRGAWEAYCSGRGIPRFAESVLGATEDPSRLRTVGDLTAPDVFAAAEAGDAVAERVLDSVARYNAAGVGAVVNAYDPGVVAVGGSVALSNPERTLSGIERHLDDYTLADPPAVRLSPLGEDAELYGAVASATGVENGDDRTRVVRDEE
ncbi:ROK family protein [Halobium salinum]|uniref:ROK family protein n=1 Tax=Halobium salinum TaxID=1364940 RepID=A0ABD5P9M1_9EURY|nr:ROK family protein [Halobium salinum]